MYRIDTLKSADGHRLYEFQIEYDTDTPAEGTYTIYTAASVADLRGSATVKIQ